MNKNKLTSEEIFNILDNSTKNIKVIDKCKKYKISRQTFYNLKKKYEGLNLTNIKQIRNLEEEINRLKKKLNNKNLEIDALQDLIEKKL